MPRPSSDATRIKHLEQEVANHDATIHELRRRNEYYQRELAVQIKQSHRLRRVVGMLLDENATVDEMTREPS